MMQPTHHFQTTDGLALAVYRQGQGEPFIFQHGLCGDARQPAAVWPKIEGIQNIAVEMRGHGRSDTGDPARFSIGTFAEDLARFIALEADAPVVLGGISMGAAIALRLAAHQPGLIRALVLARPAWVAAAAPANMQANAEVGRLLRDLPPNDALAHFIQSETARRMAETAPDNLASLRGFFSRVPLHVTAHLLMAIAADGPGVSEKDVAAIAVPTLIIGHKRDDIHPLAHAQRLASLIAQAKFVEVMPKATDPARYAEDFRCAVAQFLKSL